MSAGQEQVDQLRAAIAELPETADIVIEDSLGHRYDVIRAEVWGQRTSTAYVRLLLWNPYDPRKCPQTASPPVGDGS